MRAKAIHGIDLTAPMTRSASRITPEMRGGCLDPGVPVGCLASTNGIDDAAQARIARRAHDGSRG
jgi:hypothetical protein